jgi:hypothetical protein
MTEAIFPVRIVQGNHRCLCDADLVHVYKYDPVDSEHASLRKRGTCRKEWHRRWYGTRTEDMLVRPRTKRIALRMFDFSGCVEAIQ